MIELKVTTDTKASDAFFKAIKTQLPYAISVAVNNVTLDAQAAIRDHIHERFIVRRPAFIDKSVKIAQFARKDTLTAILRTEAPGGAHDVLGKFEEGGTKYPQGANVAVPTSTIRPNVQSVITPSKRPRALTNAFVLTTRSGKKFIVQGKRGKGMAKAGMRRTNLQFAYQLKPSVPIPARLDFVGTATRVVQEKWVQRMGEGWDKALATAR